LCKDKITENLDFYKSLNYFNATLVSCGKKIIFKSSEASQCLRGFLLNPHAANKLPLSYGSFC
ncbi:hypothetical protein P4451_15095, partial [Bacillus subtilis]|nr:hypothetical protein [Bacillus subtilis]